MWFRVGRKTGNEEGGIDLVQQWLHFNIKSSWCICIVVFLSVVENSCIFMEKLKFLSQKKTWVCFFYVFFGLLGVCLVGFNFCGFF